MGGLQQAASCSDKGHRQLRQLQGPIPIVASSCSAQSQRSPHTGSNLPDLCSESCFLRRQHKCLMCGLQQDSKLLDDGDHKLWQLQGLALAAASCTVAAKQQQTCRRLLTFLSDHPPWGCRQRPSLQASCTALHQPTTSHS